MSRIDEIWREISVRHAGRPTIHTEPEGRTWTFTDLEAQVAAAAPEPSGPAPSGPQGDGPSHLDASGERESPPSSVATRASRAAAQPALARGTANNITQSLLGKDTSRSSEPSKLVTSAAGNTVEFIVSFLAARRAEKVFVALDRSMTAVERDSVIRRFEALDLPPGTAMIKLTSGSTGEPRGVALSEEVLLAGARNIIATMGIGPDDLNVAAISLSHSYGFDNLVLPLILQGTPIVLVESFYARTVLDAIARRCATFIPLVPFMYESLLGLEGDWSSVRRCISAGAPLDPGLAARFHEKTGRKIHTFYGSTECGGITFDRSEDAVLPRGCVGTPLEGVNVDLTSEGLSVGLASDGRSADPPSEGRVRVRSEAVALGYLPQEEGGALEHGRFVTGDLGRLDESGRLVLTRRAAEDINVAGRKVAAAEIETCLRALDGVQAAIVVGLPDARRGESIGALVVAPGLDESRLLAHCWRYLPEWKVPRIVRVVERLLPDERGKLSKEAVRSLLERR